MIVTCPACSSRYRIKEEKIRGRGAKISCPKCDHKFIVHREAEPAADAKGVPVTFARGGKKIKRDFDEDDEADVPTTVMPHGSQAAQQIKAAAAAFNAEAEAPAFDRAAAHASAVARNGRPASITLPTDIEIPQDGGRSPRGKVVVPPAKAPAKGAAKGGEAGVPASLVVAGVAVFALFVLVVLWFTGVI